MTKILRISCLALMLFASAKAEDLLEDKCEEAQRYGDWGEFFLNKIQLVSLHYGFATDLNNARLDSAKADTFSGIIGVSVGYNKFSDCKLNAKPCIKLPFFDGCSGFGLRAKYLYMDTYAPTHSVGGLAYIYLGGFDELDIPREILGTLILGAGANFSKIGTSQANGWYAEVGVGLFKIFPLLLNTDIIYRVNFYNNPNELHLGTIHSLNFVWTFL